jgi:uncharacterized membrane protein (Fun14 family)
MKEYVFEYTKGDLVLILVSFGVMGLSGLCLYYALKDYPGINTILCVVFGIVFFLLTKSRVKRIGKAQLSEKGLILELTPTHEIDFNDLRYYFDDSGKNGPVFTLGFLNGSKLKIVANNNFCDDKMLDVFLTDLMAAIEKYNADYNGYIIRLESQFARKKSGYILAVVTVLVIAGYCFTTMALMLIPIGFTMPTILGWLRYSSLKRQNKQVDF